MKVTKKFHSENSRFHIFRLFYGILFLLLLIFLTKLQLFQSEQFEDKERRQGQRRILRPGSRGDILDTEGRLLIGNKAQFTAVIHLDRLKSEIWEKKVLLKKIAFKIRSELSNTENLSINNLINHCLKENHVKERSITLSGFKKDHNFARIKIYWQNQRLSVQDEKDGKWTCQISSFDPNSNQLLITENTGDEINVDVAGLFSTTFYRHIESEFLAYSPLTLKTFDPDSNFFKTFFTFANDANNLVPKFNTNSITLGWEARYAVVKKYLHLINHTSDRNEPLSIVNLKNHWNRRLVLPMELIPNLSPSEYASLIENLSPSSPVQIQVDSVRHYPHQSLASHVLGYVGSGYEAKAEGLSGEDLATFEIKGKKGKSGIEKSFDDHLRGKDGGDIWRINPMGLRFDQIEKKASEKGQSLQLTIDLDIQKVAELSLTKMSNRVSAHRVLPDSDWKKTIEKRTRKELVNKNEIELRPELLLTAFKDAPYPLSGKEASTVAGFRGTEKDADHLLRILFSKGVLDRVKSSPSKYIIAPPPPPPGAAVLLDVKTGEILTLASQPNYNLGELSPRISQLTYDRIERKEAWLPRAWHPGYCPASPFKLVTAVAALRAKVVTPNEELICDGIYKGMECHCYPGRHGPMNLRSAEAQSCNIYFFQIAERLGEKLLIAEAKSFGMNQSPDIQLPRLRNSPNVPDPEWKKKSVGEKWALEDTFNVAIGQGGLRQSPLQMACFAAALANQNRIFKPKLIKSNSVSSEEVSSQPIGLSNEDMNAIIGGMHDATIKGTAKRCKIEGIDVAGKTGTAQWRNHNMQLNLAWFIGFAPVQNPEVAIAVLIEGILPQDHIQGGLTATPVAKEILQAYFNKKNKFSRN
jgi:cell division protein FtsI/penicillin-binding protein 2